MWRTFVSALNLVMALNLAALIAIAAWLGGTGRLDRARMQAIGRILDILPADSESALLPADPGDVRDLSPAGNDSSPAAPSAVRIEEMAEWRVREVEQSRALEQQAAILRRQLLNEQAGLARQRADFESERARWESERALEVAAQTDAQFQRIITVLQDMPARQAKDYLLRIADTEGVREAARHLNAMRPFNAAAVLRQFRPEEQHMAADLLRGATTTSAGEVEIEAAAPAAEPFGP